MLSFTRLFWCGIGLSAAMLAQTLQAEFKNNPDPNTLWSEDGVNIATGAGSSNKHWSVGDTAMLVSAAPDAGGFVVQSTKPEQHATGRYVKFDPQYPYIVWEIADVTPATGYRAFAVRAGTPSVVLGGMVTHIQEGLYTCRTDSLFNKPATPFMRIELYNAKITLKYIKVVKTPDNYAQIDTAPFAAKGYVELGDEVEFKVVLADPAEDVSLRFFHSYIMKPLTVNGSQTLQLKPIDAEDKIWTARVKIDSCSTGNLKAGKQFGPSDFVVKAVVLGGSIKTPIWTCNPIEFRFNNTPAPAPAPAEPN